jgi:hypothetical protein
MCSALNCYDVENTENTGHFRKELQLVMQGVPKLLYNGIPFVQGVERWLVCAPLGVKIFVTLATQ